MFTGAVPHGTEYRSIGSVWKDTGFLDGVVAAMLRQQPGERPPKIVDLKGLIQRHRAEAVSLQRLSEIGGIVIKAGQVDEPLAHEPPRLVGARWSDGTPTLMLDRPVNQDWISALHKGSYSSVMGVPPQAFSFRGRGAVVRADEGDVQQVIDCFKEWLPKATSVLKHSLEQRLQRQEAARRERLRLEKAAEEQRLRINRSIRI